MDLDLTQLQVLTLAQKGELLPFLRGLDSFSCELSFANLMMWQEVYGTRYLKYQGRWLFYLPKERTLAFPAGEYFSPANLAAVSDEFSRAGLTDGGIYDVPDDYLSRFPETENYFEVQFPEDSFDYIYDMRRLCENSGPKLRKKRNLIRQFEAEFPEYFTVRITPDNVAVAAELALDLNRRLEHAEFIDEENLAMRYAWENFAELELDGLMLHTAPGRPVGFSVYSLLNGRTADIHFEKAAHDVKGAAQILTNLTARDLLGRAEFMNREQDLGNEGIRRAKHSLDPVCFFKRAQLSRKS